MAKKSAINRNEMVKALVKTKAAKRDAGPADPVSISGVPSPAREADQVDVLALNTALSNLAQIDQRQAEIVGEGVAVGFHTAQELNGHNDSAGARRY